MVFAHSFALKRLHFLKIFAMGIFAIMRAEALTLPQKIFADAINY